MSDPLSKSTPDVVVISPAQANEAFNGEAKVSSLQTRFKAQRIHLALRLVVICLSIIGIVGFTVSVIISNTPLYVYNDYGFAGAVMLGPISYALVLSVIYVCLILFRKKGPPHPGFGVGFDLIGWLSMSITLGLVWPLSGDPSYSHGCYGVSEERCDYLARLFFSWLLTGEIVTAISTVAIFCIFVLECIETDRLRKEKIARRHNNNRNYVPLS